MHFFPIGLRVLLTFVFVAEGGAKLFGASMMVETFDAIGWGQWFRYVTAAVELGAAVMLWVPVLSIVGSSMLFATMVCGALFLVFVIGPSAGLALVLAVLCLTLLWVDRTKLQLLMVRLGIA